jgi:hypothetical protein
VTAKTGESYDVLEALTLGEIDDPAKQICSDLAATCLPEPLRADIARLKRLGVIKGLAVSVHSSHPEHNLREFISPNGFAEYFQAPRGKQVLVPDQVAEPRPLQVLSIRTARKWSTRVVTWLAIGMAAWAVLRLHSRLPIKGTR